MANERVDAKKHAVQLFAKQIAGRMAKTVHEGRCPAPRFLGVLRDSLSVATNLQPYATVDKAVVGKDTATIEKLLIDA
jgi:protein required for attachment to host cells